MVRQHGSGSNGLHFVRSSERNYARPQLQIRWATLLFIVAYMLFWLDAILAVAALI
jgi:hypothetical protein